MHTSIGGLIDAARQKRALLSARRLSPSGCATAIAWTPTVPGVLVADIVVAVPGGVFAPTVAASARGFIGRGRLPRNAACDRVGTRVKGWPKRRTDLERAPVVRGAAPVSRDRDEHAPAGRIRLMNSNNNSHAIDNGNGTDRGSVKENRCARLFGNAGRGARQAGHTTCRRDRAR